MAKICSPDRLDSWENAQGNVVAPIGIPRTIRGEPPSHPDLPTAGRGERVPWLVAQDDTPLRLLVEDHGQVTCALDAKTRCIL